MKMKLEKFTLSTQVRYCKADSSLYAFFKNPLYKYGYECFSFNSGHSECHNLWRLECEPVDNKTAKEFITKLQDYYNSLGGERITLKLVKKLV